MARQKSRHGVVDDFGMGDRAHVPEAGEFDDADPGQRARQQPGNPAWPRAIAQTKMTISQRAVVEGVLCDIVCTGRFYDFLEKRAGRWGIVLRQPIYEKDRIDAVPQGAVPKLDAATLAGFPEGYRHLAYAQLKIGYQVKRDMPGLKGPEVLALYGRGERWLAGGALQVPGLSRLPLAWPRKP